MYLYIGLFDWTRWTMFSPPMHKFMKNNEHLKIYNMHKHFDSWTISNPIIDFLKKMSLHLHIRFFSCLFNTWTREWSKLIIKIKQDENNYHLCSSRQWPFKTPQSWFKKFITKWKLIKSIIYKKTSSRLAFEIFLKISIQKKFPKNRFFLCS